MKNLQSLRTMIQNSACQIHRWIAIILSPVFLIIIATGLILSFKPILNDFSSVSLQDQRKNFNIIQVHMLIKTLGLQENAQILALSPDGKTITVVQRNNPEKQQQAQSTGNQVTTINYDLLTGQPVENNQRTAFFNAVKKIHVYLFTNTKTIAIYAAYLMLAVLITGPFIYWPKIQNTLSGWHFASGIFLLPFLFILTLSALYVHPGPSKNSQNNMQSGQYQPDNMITALDIAAQEVDLKTLLLVRKMRGQYLIKTGTPEGEQYYLITTKGAELTNGPGILRQIHEGTWAGKWSGFLNLFGSIALFGLTVTGLYSWYRRLTMNKHNAVNVTDEILIAYASQTGTAARLAQETANIFRKAGRTVSIATLARLNATLLDQFKYSIIFISTTGDGRLPDQALPFIRSLAPAVLKNVRLSIFALGDSHYPQFCAGGILLRQHIQEAGAHEYMDMVMADGDPTSSWHQWWNQTARIFNIHSYTPDLHFTNSDVPVTLVLEKKQCLTQQDHDEIKETWQLTFSVAPGTSFRPGDLLMIRNHHSEPVRYYSIGSSSQVTPDRLQLTVNRHTQIDEQGKKHYGRVSTWLCRDLKEHDTIHAEIRVHSGFNPPDDPATPMILIGTGCGIAPFPGFIEERSYLKSQGTATGDTWLIYGNRKKEEDFLYKDFWINAFENGSLSRLDTAFSRDYDSIGYVDVVLLDNKADFIHWFINGNAILYVCGHSNLLNTVSNAIQKIMMDHKHMSLECALEQIETWKAEGKLLSDTFD